MKLRFVLFLGLMGVLSSAAVASTQSHPVRVEHMEHGRFKDVALYRPEGNTEQFVLLLSDDAGWTAAMDQIARALNAENVMVAGIDVPRLRSNLAKDDGDCVFPDGDLENLSHYLQGYAQLPTYYTPWLIGYGTGAALAYAMIAQAPDGIFSGAMSIGFCPDLNIGKPLCRGQDIHFAHRAEAGRINLLPAAKISVPWVVLHGEGDQRCSTATVSDFVGHVHGGAMAELAGTWREANGLPSRRWTAAMLAGYRVLNTQRHADVLPPPPESLADLPLIEVPATNGHSDMFAVLLSGDGGWAGLDKDVAGALVAKGIPVVGFDSLRYFWKARTPQGLANDLDRIVRYYAAHWGKTRVILVGYSQGADVLPFAINRMPASSRSMIVQTALLGLGKNASFEFHVSNWIGGSGGDALPILPEVKRLSEKDTLCLYGNDDGDSLCAEIPAGHVRAQAMPGGHHFDGSYNALAESILAAIEENRHPSP
ncbi:MAG: cutinase family protein [Xanthomonadaceae bacterium]|jgi:type IV secretory pathway VirJ component|nr:cutinase family protein [Xanthomonadaceae bacterium]